MQWAIDPKSCLVIIPCLPSGVMHESLAEWVYTRFDRSQMLRIRPASDGSYPPVVCMRNIVTRDILTVDRFKGFENIVWFDNDLQPDHRLNPMFEVEADIVGAQYDLGSPNPWLQPDSVHAAAMRFNRKVIEAMTAPYWLHEYSDDGTSVKSCDCGYFIQKAKALGFTVARAGYSAHGHQRSHCH